MPTKATFGQRGAASRSVAGQPAPSSIKVFDSPSDRQEAAPRPRHDGDFVLPFATAGLILLLGFIFAVEINQAAELSSPLSPSRQSLTALGAIDGQLVFHLGEWWRLFTAPMLHGSLSHILGNCVVLALIGWSLEPLLGAGWFIAIFAISALGGSLGSLAQNDPQLISVGASGGISGLLASALIVSSRIDDPVLRRRMQMIAARTLIPAILPAYISASANHGHVDYGAHMGGAMAGVLAAILLNITWNRETRRPRLMRVAIAICCSFGIAVTSAFAITAYRAPAYVAEKPKFIPEGQLRGDGPEMAAKSSGWIVKYPEDPRGYYYRGLSLFNHGDVPGAAEQLRRALSIYSASGDSFTPAFGHQLKLILAVVIQAEGNTESARAMGGDSCGAWDAPQSVVEIARKHGVCP
jgi:rhomboid protease GluP